MHNAVDAGLFSGLRVDTESKFKPPYSYKTLLGTDDC